MQTHNRIASQVLIALIAYPQLNVSMAQIPLPGRCDPKIQSCAPGTTPPSVPGGPGMCRPEPGGGTCDTRGPASGTSKAGVDVGAGNPINVISGNKYQRETDMPPLPGILGLEVVRHYNSAYSRPTHPNGIVGRGWKLSYETELHAVGATIQIVQADGSRVMFARNPLNPTLCTSSDPSQGTIQINRTLRGDEYRWIWTDGRILTFSSAGKLLQIKVPTGEFVTLQYDSKGLLIRVTDPQARSLRLGYLSAELARGGGKFRGVQFIDTPVGRIAYEYGGAMPKGTSGSRTQVLANLIGVSGPERHWSQRYHYEDPRHPTLLTGISIEDLDHSGRRVIRRVATYGYDEQGKGSLTVRGLPARLKSGPDGKPLQPASLVSGTGVEQVTFDTSTGGQTVISNSLGQKTIYRHTVLAGQYRLLEVRGAGCSSCGDTDVRYRYDETGRLVETIRLSPSGIPLDGIQTEFDKIGRTARVSKIRYRKGRQQSSEWLERYEYVGETNRLHLFARPSVVAGLEVQTRYQFNDHGQPVAITESGWEPSIGAKTAPKALSRTTRYNYALVNGRSLITEIDGPLPNGQGTTPATADITRIEWDARGNAIVAITQPGGSRSQLRYDEAGRIKSVIGPHGQASTFAYNARNQVVSIERDGIRQGFRYDGIGNMIESGDGEGIEYRPTLRYGHDSAGRPTLAASHLGIASTRQFDTEGKLLSESVMSANFRQSRQFQYDSTGRLIAMTDNAGGSRRIHWNETGLPGAVTDALGRQRWFRYDETGQLSQVIDAANTTHAKAFDTTLSLKRDATGRVTRVVTPGGVTTDQLTDDFGRPIATFSVDRGALTRHFDAADRLVRSKDANGNLATYEYDLSSRIVRQTLIDSRATPRERPIVTTWTYTGDRLTGIDHPDQQERYTHDSGGRVSSKTVTLTLVGGKPQSTLTEYVYDSNGRLSGTSLPDGSMLEYRRNAQGQVVALERHRIRTAWLRWLQPAEVIVKDLERDLVGLRSATFGNGVLARYHRSAEGVLGRVDYRAPSGAVTGGTKTLALSISPRANASAAVPSPGAGMRTETSASILGTSVLPLPLGHGREPNALLDHRYLWDVGGNLVLQESIDQTSTYAYDAQNRLIVSATKLADESKSLALNFSRYAYDGAGNRVLSQQNISTQTDLSTATRVARYAPGSQRFPGHATAMAPEYDATGQPVGVGTRSYRWGPAGQLLELRSDDRILARYRYDHRGLRITKEATGETQHYLYEGRKLQAELSAGGSITRQYVYLADQLVAVIDCDDVSPVERVRSQAALAVTDLMKTLMDWFFEDDATAYLHTNHLGSVEAITDADAKLLWRATYHPYGDLDRMNSQRDFQFNLRLPGQYFDAETSLHYNDHRYYDPQSGRYLTPDPIGLLGGINGYAYVDGNPLKYVDPSGLILFAFDGTGNSAPPSTGSSVSNVWKIHKAYDENLNGKAFYITGIGTTDVNMSYKGNIANGDGFDQRVALGFRFLDSFIDTDIKSDVVHIDVVGFSRGAAEARVWLNQLVARMRNGRYTSGNSGRTRCLNLRFEGLFDTVSHLGYLNGNDSRHNFAIPSLVRYAAHAVAVNEHRGGLSNFDVRSILGPSQKSAENRIEQGFIGAHSDIGGGYASGDLSDVALMWMLNQARQRGIKIVERTVEDAEWNIVTLPILHDSSANGLPGPHSNPMSAPRDDNRAIVYADGTRIQATMDVQLGGYSVADTKALINYYRFSCGVAGSLAVGLVDMSKYSEWTKKFGITIAFTQPPQTIICE